MDWNTPIISLVVSTVVSFCIGFLFSDKAVERSQLRRHHSRVLQSAISDWRQNMEGILKLKNEYNLTKFSHDKQEIVPIETGNLEMIPYHSFMENHMESGYNDVWLQWVDLKQQVQKHNTEKAILLEEIRKQFNAESRTLNLTEYYHKSGRRSPENYVAPDKIAESIFDEIMNRISGMDNWWGGEPIIFDSWTGSIQIFGLKIFNRSNIIRDTNKDHVIFCKEFILSKVEDEEIISNIESLFDMTKSNNKKFDSLNTALNEIISIIGLGQNIKGNCEHCPKLFHL